MRESGSLIPPLPGLPAAARPALPAPAAHASIQEVPGTPLGIPWLHDKTRGDTVPVTAGALRVTRQICCLPLPERGARACWHSRVPGICALVVCGAPLAARAPEVAADLAAHGWRVDVVITPSAASWTDESSLAAATGQPPRSAPLLAGSGSERGRPGVVVVAPVTFNTVGKMACGIADTYAHGVLCESLGDRVPVLAVPMVSNRLWAHPAWAGNTARLTEAGVRWLSIHDGSVGPPQPVRSGTGGDVVRNFVPGWISAQLPR